MTDLSVVLRTPWGGPWRAFRDPLAVLTAHAADDVSSVLAEVDRAVRSEGCYAAGFVTVRGTAIADQPIAPGHIDPPAARYRGQRSIAPDHNKL